MYSKSCNFYNPYKIILNKKNTYVLYIFNKNQSISYIILAYITFT